MNKNEFNCFIKFCSRTKVVIQSASTAGGVNGLKKVPGV
jgi:hypothetical protein